MYPLWPYQAAWNPGMPAGTCAGGAIPGPMSAAHVAPAAGRTGTTVAISRSAPRKRRITRSNSLAKAALRVAAALGLRFVGPLELRERGARDPAGAVPHVTVGLAARAVGPAAL